MKYNSFGDSKTIESDALHACRSVKGHPKGDVFLVGGENSNVALIHFDPSAKYESWLLEAQGTYEGHSDAIRHIEHNKGGDLMLTSCADHSLRIWDLNTTRCMALFAGHKGLVVSFEYLGITCEFSLAASSSIRTLLCLPHGTRPSVFGITQKPSSKIVPHL